MMLQATHRKSKFTQVVSETCEVLLNKRKCVEEHMNWKLTKIILIDISLL